jgi:copper(I)-binding protein
MTAPVRALVVFAFGLAAPATAAPPPTLTDAWIRATPPGARTAAAYLTISSAGAADRLLGATTAAARGVEIHEQVAENGLQRMVRLPEVALLPGESVRFEAGGLHLMLIDIAAPLAPGTTVSLSLEFAVAGTIAVDVPVVDARVEAPLAHGAH